MKKYLLILLVALVSFNIQAQQDGYRYEIDITKVEDDKLTVSLIVPEGVKEKDKAIFHIPKIIPGTYAIYDFGQYASNMKAYDKSGKEVTIKNTDVNSWEVADAKNLHKIVYQVEDTWDTELVAKFSDDYVFEPAGTNFEDKENFIFNINGICGYFKGFERTPFYVSVDRPADFFGATALTRSGGDEDTDIFYASNYMDLQDGPIMFSKPDTAMLKVGNADVLIANYSPNGKVKASDIAKDIEPILQAQRAYLGGTLPVTKYAFIIYLANNSNSGGFGALEHSYSSFYFLPESEPANISQIVKDVAAHEFFHIVTPLNIHAEEIHNFDYINPKMSEHLWMYEGVTEYSAGHVQVKHGLMPLEQYLDVLEGKMRNAATYKDDLPFTTLSRLCLKEHKDQYTNVYEKGALIGMCVDILARKKSKGKKGIQELMQDLSKEYGKEQAFKDEDLFKKIGKLTHRKVKKFLIKHVAGPTPLPLAKTFKSVGINYFPKRTEQVLSPIGGLSPKSIGFDGSAFFISSLDGMDAFATENIGFKVKDKLIKWNGEALSPQSINQVIGTYAQSVKEGDELKITVIRDGKEMELSTKIEKIAKEIEHVLELNPDATKKQLKLRKAWLGDYKMEADIK
ncbi:MAG: peptidase M61 [Saprospiraceae bacterium]